MILISHRGNIDGKNESSENNPSYIETAIKLGYDVEVDVRYVNNDWWLGHDEPQYKISIDYLNNPKLWVHCKNWEAISELSKTNNIKYFWHQEDDYTLVSNGLIWVYPNKELIENSICCLPELGYSGNLNECHAICSDYVNKYLNIINLTIR